MTTYSRIRIRRTPFFRTFDFPNLTLPLNLNFGEIRNLNPNPTLNLIRLRAKQQHSTQIREA